jgi:hypothetical protein
MDYAVSIPNKQSRFGKSLTSRYRESTFALSKDYYIFEGPARMENENEFGNERIVIGELSAAATWINGRLELQRGKIIYRKYDKKGIFVPNSKLEFVNFKWVKSVSETSMPVFKSMPAQRRQNFLDH